MQDAARLQSQQQWVTDPNFRNTTLLLQADNAAGGAQNNTFLDSSSNSFAITRNGNTTQGTFTPFSQGWSNFFDGTGDYLTATYSTTNFDWFTTGTDFTLEAWIYPTTFTGWTYSGDLPTLIGNMQATGPTNYWSFGPKSDGKVRLFYFNGSVITVDSTQSCNLNQWNHIAFTKTSSGIAIFVNGVGTTATAISGTPQSSTGVTLSIGSGNSSAINGYVSNLRIVKGGTALYSGTSYTVPTAPLANITNTTLLTCQSNRFVDNSSVANALTVNGPASVQPFAPFAPQFQYTQSGIGGSGYFDGSGDFLSFASNAAFTVGTGDLTIEAWIYVTSLSQTFQGILSGRADVASNFPGLGLVIDNSQLFFTILNVGSGLRDSATVPLNQWVHVAGVRSGTSAALFVNGVRKASSTNSENGTSSDMVVGRYYPATNNYYFSGYISGARLVKGTAVYDPTQTTITVPTAPLTAITNTSLLLNFTNAGIIDGTMDNVLETVGNAQVSTSVVKYGSGSMAFDGVDDYLITPYKPFLRFGGDFTIEFWAYPIARVNTYPAIITNYSTFTTNGLIGIFCGHNATQTKWSVGFNGADGVLVSTSDVVYGAWVHVAVVRQGSILRLYINGVSEASSTQTVAVVGTANFWWIGTAGDALTAGEYHGYLDDLRITSGVARYTANFTPPQVALPRQ